MQPGDIIEAYLTREGEDYAIPTCPLSIVNNNEKQETEVPVLIGFDNPKRVRLQAKLSGRYHLYSSSGQLFDSGDYSEGETTLGFDSAPRGIYFMRFELSDGSIYTQSVIL